MSQSVVIRPAPAARFLVAVFMIWVCGMAGWAAIKTGWGLGLVGALVIIALIGLLAIRMVAIAAIASGDELLVRNAYSTRRLSRCEIESFAIAPAPIAAFRRTIYVRLREESIALDVGLAFSRLLDGPHALEERLGELQAWLARSG